MAEQVQSGPQQSRARRFLGAGKRTLDGEDRSERIKTGRKGTPFRAFSPTIKPEFPKKKVVEAQAVSLGAHRNSRDYGNFIPTPLAAADNGSAAPGRPSPDHQGSQ